ncbi:hypothetical protein ACROYT_G015236 [Oculina patagonica]
MLSKFSVTCLGDTAFTTRFRHNCANGAQSGAQPSSFPLQEVYGAEIRCLRAEIDFIKQQHNSAILHLNTAVAQLQQANTEILQLKHKAPQATAFYNTKKDFLALTKSARSHKKKRVKQRVVQSVQGLDEFKLIELEFQDSDVFDLLQEMGAYLEGHLGQLDMANPPADYLVHWDRMVLLALRFLTEQPTFRDLVGNGTRAGNNMQQESRSSNDREE